MEKNGWLYEWAADAVRPYELPSNELQRGDDEQDEEWLTRLGFKCENKTGLLPHADRWEVWSRATGEGHPFAVVMTDSMQPSRIIFLPSFDAFLRLQALIAPAVSAALLQDHLNELQMMAEKAFQTWHGHSNETICSKCDPHEWKLEQQRKARIT